MVAPVPDLLEDDDAFDLDALANEASEKPFAFKVDGDRFTLCSPMDLDWKVIEELQALTTTGNLKPVFEMLMPPGEYELFLDKRIPIGKLLALMTAWTAHFGVSLGELPASPRRSAPKRRR